MKRQQIVLLLLLVLGAAGVALLALRTNRPPYLPEDADHATFVGEGRCLTCHGPQGSSPQSKNHPASNECMRCHGRR